MHDAFFAAEGDSVIATFQYKRMAFKFICDYIGNPQIGRFIVLPFGVLEVLST